MFEQQYFPDGESERLIKELTAGIDDSVLGQRPEYPSVPADDIASAEEHSPLRADILRLMNATAEKFKDSDGFYKENHDAGWTTTITTAVGNVCLWSCWLKDRFQLMYDGERLTPDEIKSSLGVQGALPVKWRDGERQWAPFYGPRLPQGGRIWIDTKLNDFDKSPTIINAVGEPTCPARPVHTLCTYPSSFFSEQSPDSPSALPKYVQEYTEKFILLAAKLAFQLGQLQAVHTEFASATVTHHTLAEEGYQVEWLRGIPEFRRGYGHDLVVGRRNGETVALRSGNSLVPWIVTRCIDVGPEITKPVDLALRMLTEDFYI